MHLTNSDEELLERLNDGDRSAFEAIYHRYAPSLLAFTRKTISNKDECSEIVQDIFESLWKRRGHLNVQSLKAYLFSAARYLMIRYFRRARLTREYAEHFTVFEPAYDSIADSIVENLDDEIIREKLLKAIDGLVGHCRIALKLRLQENLSNSEIAERMNITKGTVELYMVKAVRQLRADFNIGNSR